jgi:hypothetical protein
MPLPGNWQAKGTGDLSVGLTPAGVVFVSYCGSVAHLSTASLARDAPLLAFRRAPSISTSRFNHTVMHSFLPHALALQGELMMHAACVEIDGAAWLFAGTSGMGKSTLAAGLGRRGFRVLSEDVLRIELTSSGPIAFPSYPGVRLRADNFLVTGGAKATAAKRGRYGLPKYRLDLPQVPEHLRDEPVRLRGAVFLRGGSAYGGRFNELSGPQTVHHLLSNAFVRAIPRPRLATETFPQMVRLAGSLTGLQLAYRKSPAHFDQLLDHIVARLSEVA